MKRQRKSDIAALVAALEEISEPLAFMQMRAKAQGRILDGSMAITIAKDPEYLRGIARQALERWANR